MTHRWISLLSILVAAHALGQTEAPRTAPMQQGTTVRDGFQGGWSVATGQLAKAEEKELDDAELEVAFGLDVIRSERNASLARNQGVIPQSDQGRIQALSDELNRRQPDSFDAHMANYYTAFPTPTAFQELDLAIARDRDRAELVAPRLVNAVRTDNTTELTLRAKDMRDRGGIAPPLYLVANDILASTEPGAIFFAAGDMDLFPLLVEQFVRGKRKDLLVVDLRLLGDPSYRLRIWERTKASGKVAPADQFVQDLASATVRPVYVSLALGQKELAPLKEKLYTTGLAMRYSTIPIDNIPLLESRWAAFRKPMDAGPLSQNYLLPGSVLLLHYRAIGDEPRASRLEYELRDLAQRVGATNALFRSGVLAH
ncbi:MAG: hypothetical protein IPH05_09495 [Flavobacteriales bacterium]|jgi:hypothetical protein|nr:hypothetical protein [Flavobacteriales bacterium]MBK6883158.1 hypothetical protein [Flavobacteriales bacterium]MBK7103196.1 hypothetical protein [Flavobacteriales bacterium]MBK7112829.1 hypothetical protein [Flavobacteriales bacterium]MBK7481455.1 hypothetical protein [Flavobacteriales bacterium]